MQPMELIKLLTLCIVYASSLNALVTSKYVPNYQVIVCQRIIFNFRMSEHYSPLSIYMHVDRQCCPLFRGWNYRQLFFQFFTTLLRVRKANNFHFILGITDNTRLKLFFRGTINEDV